MTRSQELFELLARRARATKEAARPDAPAAEKPTQKSKKSKITNTKGVSPPSPSPAPAPQERARAERARGDALREEGAPAVESEPRIAAPGAIVMSRRGATLIGSLTMILVAVAFLAGERVGRSGRLGAPPIASLTKGVAESNVVSEPVESARSSEPLPPSGETYGVRVVTYEFNPPNAERASEVLEYLREQGFRDVDARPVKNGTELRIYAGRYSRQDDPALVSMRDKVRSLPGVAKAGKKDALPFASAYIMRRGD